MSGFQFAIDEQRAAMKMFPNETSVGAALAKWYATPTGKAVNANFNRDYYAEQQRKSAVGNGYESAGIGDHIAWGGAVAGSASVGTRDKPVRTDGVNSGSAADTPVGKQHANLVTKDNIDVLMKRYGLNFDQAASLLARGGQ